MVRSWLHRRGDCRHLLRDSFNGVFEGDHELADMSARGTRWWWTVAKTRSTRRAREMAFARALDRGLQPERYPPCHNLHRSHSAAPTDPGLLRHINRIGGEQYARTHSHRTNTLVSQFASDSGLSFCGFHPHSRVASLVASKLRNVVTSSGYYVRMLYNHTCSDS